MLVAIAHQPDLDLVLAIQRKRVMDEGAAARADRKTVDVFFLRELRGNSDGLAAGRAARASDRDAADLLRGGDVAVQQCRREIADRHVVEAVAGFIGRQQRRGIDLDREEIADGVLVFGARQPAKRGGAAGIWMRRGGAIERRLEGRDHRGVGRLVGPLLATRRHLAGAELADDLLPHVRMPRHILRRDGVEGEPGLLLVLVVAGHAVFVDERALQGWRGGRGDRRAGVGLPCLQREDEPAR